MAQETEQRHEPQPQTATSSAQQQRYRAALPREVHMVVPFITVVDLLVLSAAAIDRATWAFAPVYVGVALSYVLGGLYLFAKMLDHSDMGGDKSAPPVRRRTPES